MSAVPDPANVDETICRQFESAWFQGLPKSIESFFQGPPGEPDLPTLEELVLTEMELAWKNWSRHRRDGATAPRPVPVENYLRRFPPLDRSECRRRLIDAEMELRQRFGDSPSENEFAARFPELTMRGEHGAGNVPPPPSRFCPGAAVSRLRLVEPIGRGNFGVVWKAFDPHLRRHVAVKQLGVQHQTEQDLQQRFQEEARIAAGLEHPGIVPVYDLAASTEREPYYVMKLLNGETFAVVIRRYHTQQKGTPQANLAFLHLLNTLLGVARAVAYAHAQGVLHRDLKPANVLVGAFGETVVLDWGLARTGKGSRDPVAGGDPHATREGTIEGTPAYMAPEQAAGRTAAISERTDVYALGAILYELLTGRLPFPDESAEGVLRKVLTEVPAPPRQLSAEIPRSLEAVALKALAKEPEQRYASANAFVRELERFLADEPVEAWPEPWAQRLARWGRRHRPLVAGGGVGTGILLFALSVGLILLARANATERNLRQAAQQETLKAERQRARAERHYRLARESVETYLTKVAEDERLRAFGLEPLRRDLLDSARVFFDRFVAEEDDPAVRGDRAVAYFKLADIESGTGNTKRALELSEQGSAIVEALAAETPRELSVLKDAIQADQWFGQTLGKSGQFDRAESLYVRSFERCEQAMRDYPDDRRLRELLITGHITRGSVRLVRQQFETATQDFAAADRVLEESRRDEGDTGQTLARLHFVRQLQVTTALFRQDFPQARATLERSAEVLAKLQERKPTDPDLKNAKAMLLFNKGNVEKLTNHPQEAESFFRQARDLLLALTEEHPKVTAYRLALGGVSTNLGQLAADKGQSEAAVGHFSDAIRILEALLLLEPKEALARQSLALAYWNRGFDRALQAQRPEALADFDKALEFASGVNRTLIRNRRAAVLVELGQYREAAREAEAIAVALKQPPEQYYLVACVLARCAHWLGRDDSVPSLAKHIRIAQLQTKAVAILRELSAANYFDTPQHRKELERDTRLDMLRQRPDFKALLAPPAPAKPVSKPDPG